MRVHIYTLRYNPLTGGGSHHSLEIFIHALFAAGHTPILTTLFSGGNNYGEKPCEIREERFEGGSLSLQKHVAARMHENTDADVHCLYSSYILWAGGMYKKAGGRTPVTATLNNYTPGMGLRSTSTAAGTLHRAKWYLWEKLFGIRLVQRIDCLYFDSPIIQEHYRTFGYRGRSELVVPAPMEKIPESSSFTPFTRGKNFHVVFAGRFINDKGPDLLLEAALRLPESIHMHLIGSGPEETRLNDFIRSNKLTERVFMYGWKDPAELFSFYKSADVFVQPSRWPEPFGRTVAGALQCGTPVIATEHTGSAWAAGDGGVSFKKDDVADLARCILFFFNDPNERAAYAKRALARSRLFDADAISRQFVTSLESLAKASPTVS